MKRKCECPHTGRMRPGWEVTYSDEERPYVNHEPNKCKCTNELKLYKRGTKKLWLCSCCCLPGDERP